MSIFNSVSICSSKPNIISLREKSPEIPTKTKISSNSAFLSEKTKTKIQISSRETNIPKQFKSDLVLTYEIDKKECSSPLTEESKPMFTSKDNFKNYILGKIKNDDEFTLQDKLAYSLLLLMNKDEFTEELIKEFNEEECHLSLLNWVWRYNKKFKQFQALNQFKIILIENFEIVLPQYNKLLIEINIILELLINILNFFVILPINSNDILNLKLYEKLSKIKENIKTYANDYLLNLINFVLNKWKTEVDEENEIKILARYKLGQLGVKHSRPGDLDEKEDKEDTEADSVDDSEINIKNIINNNSNIKSNLNKKTKNNIKVSFDLQNNSVIYFQKDDIPSKISLDKQKIDKSNIS